MTGSCNGAGSGDGPGDGWIWAAPVAVLAAAPLPVPGTRIRTRRSVSHPDDRRVAAGQRDCILRITVTTAVTEKPNDTVDWIQGEQHGADGGQRQQRLHDVDDGRQSWRQQQAGDHTDSGIAVVAAVAVVGERRKRQPLLRRRPHYMTHS